MPTPACTGSVPELTVAAVIKCGGRFLLVEEWVNGRLVLNQPAGHVEDGETLVAAVIREVLEEAAATFIPETTIGIYTWMPGLGRSPYLRVAFAGQCTAQDSRRTLDTGVERVLWLSRPDLLARSSQLRSPMVLRAIDDYERGIREAIDLYQDVDPAELMLRAVVL